MSWTKARDLKAWADTYAARHELPLLLRRLVRATVSDDGKVLFPAGEQVSRPGFDGTVSAAEGNQFVPAGDSYWEAGVDRDCLAKAQRDFDKRTETTPAETRAESTFIFVTPREWRKKDEWAERVRGTTDWRHVKALDANDLEHWLETLPHVDAWFSHQSGSRPEGVIDLEVRWKALRDIARHTMLPTVFLASREAVLSQLREWVSGPPASLQLRSPSVEDGFDFLCAAVGAQAEDPYDGFDRLVVVESIPAWRSLAASRRPLILVASVSLGLSAEDAAEAIANSHHVLIVGTAHENSKDQELVLPRQDTYAVEQELLESGFDSADAERFARSAGGSTTILKRLAAKHPVGSSPEWAADAVKDRLAPFALLGGWRHVVSGPPADSPLPISQPLDVDCVCELTGVIREELEELLTRWSRCDDPFFLRFGDSVVLASREDAWHRLGAAIDASKLERFEELAALVLAEDNPAFELPAKDWWAANIYGKATSLSAEFRRGIVESLALMATTPTFEQPTDRSFPSVIRNVLAQSLPEGSSWRRWATFDRQLELIAEADPEFLLSRIEGDLKSAEPEVPKLLEQRADGGAFPTWTHCGLLWALEILSWEPRYLDRATQILCRLVEYEQQIPGNYSNRPSNSLREIFLSWNPQTNANLEQKLAVLRRANELHPTVVWRFLVSQLPGGIGSISHPTAKPKWRDWASGWSREKNQSDWPEYAFALVDLLIEQAGTAPERWAGILNGVFRCGDDVSERALQTLERLAETSRGEGASASLWLALGRLVRSHRSFAEADWAYPEAVLSRLEGIAGKIEPRDPVIRSQWLFDRRVDLLGHSGVGSDRKRHEEELKRQQKQALVEVVSKEGFLGVERLIGSVERPHGMGWIVGEHQLLKPTDFDLVTSLISDNESMRVFAHDYVMASVVSNGLEFFDTLDLGEMESDHAVAVACAAPYQRETWNWIDQRLSRQTADLYWNRCRGWAMQMPADDVTFAVERLLAAKRAFSAASHVHQASHSDTIDRDCIARVLEAGFKGDANAEPLEEIDTYAIQELIAELQKEESFDRSRLARIEFEYLPLLDRHTSRTQPQTLFEELSRSPQLYVDLVTLVYRGDHDDPEDERRDKNTVEQARRAHELLEAFSTIPGTGENEQINEESLLNWVSEVRRLAEIAHRTDIADSCIGRVLATVPPEDLQAWPPPEICRVIESIATEPMMNSFAIGVVNGRGVSFKRQEGGDPLRKKADSFRSRADALQAEFPNVADALRSVAAHYEASARRDDDDFERRKLGR